MALMVLLGASCSTTHQSRYAKTSGFLEDYSHLRKGGDREPQLVYFNPAADIRDYDMILIDPIEAYMDKTAMEEGAKSDLQILLNYFHATLREQLGQDYELVGEPGPGVLRLRIALTDAKASKVAMDTLSTVVPVGLAISALERIALGKTLTAGFVRIEAEAIDCGSGIQVAAMVDERSGSKVTGRFDKWNKWQDARDAFDYWAWRLRVTLEVFRDGKGMKAPKASLAKP